MHLAAALNYDSGMQSKAKTVKEYLDALPEDRRKALQAVRKVIKANLDKGYKEGMQYGMIGYFVPHTIYPDGYHCDPSEPLPFASIASQKNHMAIYMMCVYSDAKLQEWFKKAWAKTGKKLDMGKSCVRFKKLEDLPLEIIGETIRRVPVKKYVDHYVSVLKTTGKRPAKKKVAVKAKVKKTAPKKKSAKKKATAKKK
ncbi:MAG: hypothetical protein DHS20C16_08630 [Phycisphaerae bacterium]|nr:MAG: hypothetical protein DHS20C16_08630 [Phycisphaerae bacterium]